MDKTHCLFSGYLPCSNRFSFRLTDCRYRCISLFKITFYSLRLIDCLKIITYCATVPVILSAILNFVNPMFNDGILVILLSLFFFFVTTKTNHGISSFLKGVVLKTTPFTILQILLHLLIQVSQSWSPQIGQFALNMQLIHPHFPQVRRLLQLPLLN